MSPPRSIQYKNGFMIYPDSTGLFDRAVCLAARSQLQNAIIELRQLDKLSKSELARLMDIPRNRVHELLKRLDLESFYKQQNWLQIDNKKLLVNILGE